MVPIGTILGSRDTSSLLASTTGSTSSVLKVDLTHETVRSSRGPQRRLACALAGPAGLESDSLRRRSVLVGGRREPGLARLGSLSSWRDKERRPYHLSVEGRPHSPRLLLRNVSGMASVKVHPRAPAVAVPLP